MNKVPLGTASFMIMQIQSDCTGLYIIVLSKNVHFLPTFPDIICAPGWKGQTQVCGIVSPLASQGLLFLCSSATPFLSNSSLKMKFPA